MQLIKLDAIASTNGYLKQLSQEKNLPDYTVVTCEHQTQGRGQKGNSWISDKGKNLTVSVLKRFDSLDVGQSFNLNCLVSLAIFEVLNDFSIPEVKVKWPNDIMSGNRKLCGILIENSLSGSNIKHSIIGFGLNVNQVYFNDLPNATSMKLESGLNFDLVDLLNQILKRLESFFNGSLLYDSTSLHEKYETTMYRKAVKARYALPDGKQFLGTIRGITRSGELVIEKDNGQIAHFNFKEVQYVI